ncbi:MAG: SagB/ThcOx family dehydrogenase [Candidatus Latescibacterota bacterium]
MSAGGLRDATEVAFAYHEATKHHLDRYAPGPGRLDWATQPDPFRRYAGAPLVPLDRFAGDEDGPALGDALARRRVGSVPLDRAAVSRLFWTSLAISAWKQAGGVRWALRVNPSSGNLHPTEGYLLAGAVPGMGEGPAVWHYAPREHALELRARVPAGLWRELTEGLAAGTAFVGLTSIHWREAWKYGERAWRYCQHDLGHALAAVAVAAAGLGWRATLLDDLATEEVAALMGTLWPPGAAEPEHAESLVALTTAGAPPPALRLPARAVARFGALQWTGSPNALSSRRVAWPGIDRIAAVTARPAATGTPDATAGAAARERPALPEGSAVAAQWRVPLAQIVRQRRSAVEMDGRTRITAPALYRILDATLPERVPFDAFRWEPRVDLALVLHRVDGLDPGLYLLLRDAGRRELLRAAVDRGFAWDRPSGCPAELALHCLATGDTRSAAGAISCHQAIAADGCFSLGMLAAFADVLAREGAWTYPRLYWECGAIGQMLYLAAQAEGVAGTGIGCFFDDGMHRTLGLEGHARQDLYHFTVGGPVADERLTTLPAYPPPG